MRKLILLAFLLSGFAFGQCPRSAPSVSVSISSATDTTIVSGTPGKKIYVWQFALENNSAADVTVVWKDGTTAKNGAGNLLKSGGGAWTRVCGGMAFIYASPGADLVITTSGTGTLDGKIDYTVE
jgi:hypothetical protein